MFDFLFAKPRPPEERVFDSDWKQATAVLSELNCVHRAVIVASNGCLY